LYEVDERQCKAAKATMRLNPWPRTAEGVVAADLDHAVLVQQRRV
jgi:hypothetical protein